MERGRFPTKRQGEEARRGNTNSKKSQTGKTRGGSRLVQWHRTLSNQKRAKETWEELEKSKQKSENALAIRMGKEEVTNEKSNVGQKIHLRKKKKRGGEERERGGAEELKKRMMQPTSERSAGEKSTSKGGESPGSKRKSPSTKKKS